MGARSIFQATHARCARVARTATATGEQTEARALIQQARLDLDLIESWLSDARARSWELAYPPFRSFCAACARVLAGKAPRIYAEGRGVALCIRCARGLAKTNALIAAAVPALSTREEPTEEDQ